MQSLAVVVASKIMGDDAEYKPVLEVQGALFFKLGDSGEFPFVDTPLVKLLRNLASTPKLKHVPEEDRETACFSLALAISRAEYHRSRFGRVCEQLEKRRNQLGVPSTLDTMAKFALFEAASALGAARLAVDELVYLVARSMGAKNGSEVKRKWETSKVYEGNLSDPNLKHMNIPEVQRLRKHLDWFKVLNLYRNVLHHRGWKSMTGFYRPKRYAGPPIAPEDDVMMVPDKGSLGSQSKPHQWTYTEKRRLEWLVEECISGMRTAMESFVTGAWGVQHQRQGTDPDGADMILSLPRPFVEVREDMLVMPLFTTLEEAKKYVRASSRSDLHPDELVKVKGPWFMFAMPAVPEEALGGAAMKLAHLVPIVDPRFTAGSVKGGVLQAHSTKRNLMVGFDKGTKLYCVVIRSSGPKKKSRT